MGCGAELQKFPSPVRPRCHLELEGQRQCPPSGTEKAVWLLQDEVQSHLSPGPVTQQIQQCLANQAIYEASQDNGSGDLEGMGTSASTSFFLEK